MEANGFTPRPAVKQAVLFDDDKMPPEPKILGWDGERMAGTAKLTRREISALRKLPGFSEIFRTLEAGGRMFPASLTISVNSEYKPTTIKIPRKSKKVQRRLSVHLTLNAEVRT